MKHKNPNMLVSPGNWAAIKASFPGIAAAANGNQSTTVQGTVGRFAGITVLDKEANSPNSEFILETHGLRPVTYQEILIALDRDWELKEKLKGRWFWLEGKGVENGGDHTLQPDGSLKEGRSEDLEKTVYIMKEDSNLLRGEERRSLEVYTDEVAVITNRRYRLITTIGSAAIASAVVGIPEELPVNSICKDARRQT